MKNMKVLSNGFVENLIRNFMMKTRILTVLFALLPVLINAQNFAPVGATWHYSYQTIDPHLISFEKIESVSDTTINGILCKKLVASNSVQEYYVYSKNDSVFVYKENSFHLLYDFGATTGDTITLGSYYTTQDGLPLKMKIDSVATLLVSGRPRKVQFVTCGDGMIIEFGGQVIEGIGNTNYLFPTLDFSPTGPLRCYQDTATSLFFNPYYTHGNWNQTDCEQFIVIHSLPESETGNSMSVFPNPASNYLNVAGIELNSDYCIYDTTGRKVLQGVVHRSNTVDIQSLESGIYSLEIKDGVVNKMLKFIKK
jgi:uncharacterized protein YlzI (FlbEa/FlbD family)